MKEEFNMKEGKFEKLGYSVEKDRKENRLEGSTFSELLF